MAWRILSFCYPPAYAVPEEGESGSIAENYLNKKKQ